MPKKATLKVEVDAETLHQFMMKCAGRWGRPSSEYNLLVLEEVAEEVEAALNLWIDDAPAGVPARRKNA